MPDPPRHRHEPDDAPTPRRVAVIGGGLAGLVAAHRLAGRPPGSPKIEVSLFEASDRFGGILRSVRDGEWLVEHGPDMLQTKPAAVSLIERLGLEGQAIGTETRYRGALVLKDGKPVPVPSGFALMSPNRPRSLATTPLLRPAGRARAIAEAFVPPGPPDADPSVADFARRRFGVEAFERLVEPLVAGIYTGDAERISLRATLPRFLDDERRHGSLTRAATSRRTSGSRGGGIGPAAADADTGARYGEFLSFPDGIAELTDRLAERLDAADRVFLRPSTPVTAVTPAEDDWRVAIADGPEERFDDVVLAVSAAVAARLCVTCGPLADRLAALRHASSAVVITRHRLADVGDPLAAFGLVVPTAENRSAIAISFTSRKFPGRAPEGHVLLRTFLGGVKKPSLLERTDEELIEMTRRELAEILDAKPPDHAEVVRWPGAMPQYEVGHLERIAELDRSVAESPGLHLCGLSYRGVGIADVIAEAEKTAETVAER
ncbi:MAG: protoporphyrinogen oxidase [Planctomycetota bacterium]